MLGPTHHPATLRRATSPTFQDNSHVLSYRSQNGGIQSGGTNTRSVGDQAVNEIDESGRDVEIGETDDVHLQPPQ